MRNLSSVVLVIVVVVFVLLDVIVRLRPVHAQSTVKVFIDQQSTSTLGTLTLQGKSVLGFSCNTASCYVLSQ